MTGQLTAYVFYLPRITYKSRTEEAIHRRPGGIGGTLGRAQFLGAVGLLEVVLASIPIAALEPSILAGFHVEPHKR